MKVKDLESGEIQEWSLKAVLEEINRDRSGSWTDYDESDWLEGWNEWVEGEHTITTETNTFVMLSEGS